MRARILSSAADACFLAGSAIAIAICAPAYLAGYYLDRAAARVRAPRSTPPPCGEWAGHVWTGCECDRAEVQA